MSMLDTDIARLIREVLAEELAKININSSEFLSTRLSGVEERWVNIETDAGLNAFVHDIIGMIDNQQNRTAFEKGKIVYRLKNGTSNSAVEQTSTQNREQPMDGVMIVESGFFSERQADSISGNTKRLRIGKAVKMTPLARDRLRQRGIIIERMDT